jgi:hypothetical protein
MTETKLKAVNIEATFPELKGRFSTPTGRGHAPNVRAARANAMRDLLKQVKGKKFRNATATISFWNYHSRAIKPKILLGLFAVEPTSHCGVDIRTGTSKFHFENSGSIGSHSLTIHCSGVFPSTT